jgi:hypothetical protein
VLSVRTPDRARLHRLFRCETPKRAKTARNRSPGGRFQADSAPIQTDREDGVQLHETAGGQGSTCLAAECRKSRRGRPQGEA